MRPDVEDCGYPRPRIDCFGCLDQRLRYINRSFIIDFHISWELIAASFAKEGCVKR